MSGLKATPLRHPKYYSVRIGFSTRLYSDNPQDALNKAEKLRKMAEKKLGRRVQVVGFGPVYRTWRDFWEDEE